MSERQSIRGPDERKYWIQAPNLYDDANLTVHEFRLLIHYKRVGTTTESTRTTAKKCHMALGSVVKARDGLKKKGWISVGESDAGTKKILVVDVWVQNTAIYGGVWQACSPSERSVEDVRHVNALAEYRSPSERKCSPDEPKKNHIKKNQEDEEKPIRVSDAQRSLAEHVFKRETGLEPVGAKSLRGTKWWSPLREICKMIIRINGTEDDMEALIVRTIERMNKDRLTIVSPLSILNVANLVMAETKRGFVSDPIEQYEQERGVQRG